jgi:Mg-chelatase subunit ChlI
MTYERIVYPFTAIVDQDRLKLALLLNAINPQIGGVLIRGPKGTGKSTSVRALAELLPDVMGVKECLFKCSPTDPTNMCEVCFTSFKNGTLLPAESRRMRIVNLPIGATEDRVIGSLDIEKAIQIGVRALEPGILAEANQNILYIDEVNLLPDHITDDILDASASGWNVVEREGISVAHPSRFILIGTMNPEEGELRPQLLDRFSLHITVSRVLGEHERVEIIQNNLLFGENPMTFRQSYEAAQEALRQRNHNAMLTLNEVKTPQTIFEVVARSCIDLHIDGHRPDIVIVRAARTLAAFEGRIEVTPEDILRVAPMAVGVRTRREGFEEPATEEQVLHSFTTTFEAKGVELPANGAIYGTYA